MLKYFKNPCIFESPESLNPLMNKLLSHSIMAGTYDRVLKYMGKPVKENGQPHPLAKPELLIKVGSWDDGTRVRHYVDKNSVKFYNQQNILRIETTMNNPSKFKVQRLKEGDDKSADKKYLPMRKGVADINLRAKVSSDCNKRFSEQLATVSDKTPVGELFNSISAPSSRNGKRIGGMDIIGKDSTLLKAISDPIFNAGSISNKELQQKLLGTDWANKMTGKRLSSKISRHISLLRSHGLIRKLPKQNKYALTEKGRKITSALNAALSASTEDLMAILQDLLLSCANPPQADKNSRE